MKVLDEASSKIVLVVDQGRRLLGTVTDGDIRRAILRSIGLSSAVTEVMNSRPRVMAASTPKELIVAALRKFDIRQMPLVDHEQRVVGLVSYDEAARPGQLENLVVLMAGGRGSRLQPLTDACPKPMLKIGDKPLLETILLSFIDAGFHRFYFSVNYMAEVIEKHFGDGSAWNVQITYLREKEPLGTAGALSLLPEVPEKPVVVMNGDLLTRLNFAQMLDFHSGQQSAATMAVREYDFEVPYGVVNLQSTYVVNIAEKPVQRYFVNAGVYVIEPSVLSLITPNAYLDMPTLFQRIMDQQQRVAAFPVIEYCLDVGRPDDFAKAHQDFPEVFS